MRGIIQAGLIAPCEVLKDRVLASGFDQSGIYLRELSRLGLKGVQVGQVSSNPSAQEESVVQLGIRHVIANVHGFRESHGSELMVEIEIAPDMEVIQYTPYLIEENLVQAVSAYCEIQKMASQAIANTLLINLRRAEYEINASPE